MSGAARGKFHQGSHEPKHTESPMFFALEQRNHIRKCTSLLGKDNGIKVKFQMKTFFVISLFGDDRLKQHFFGELMDG